MIDNWRMIKGYEGSYWISCFGDIKNKRGRILTPIILNGGIKVIDLYGEGLRERKLIDVLLRENYPELFKGEEL